MSTNKNAKPRNLSRLSLASTAAPAYDRDEAHRVLAVMANRNLREVPAPDLHQAIADLQRAGVRLSAACTMPGKTLLEQCQAEEARRASRNIALTVHARQASYRQQPGSYSAIVEGVSGQEPKKYSVYY
jgi:hypothetical protein